MWFAYNCCINFGQFSLFIYILCEHIPYNRGWLGGAMVLGKLPVPGRPTIWIKVGQGLTALAVGAGWGCLDIFTLIYPFSPLPPSLWETARYRLKYCLKGPLNPKQPTNQPIQYFTNTLPIAEVDVAPVPPPPPPPPPPLPTPSKKKKGFFSYFRYKK